MPEPALPQEDPLRTWVRDWLARPTPFVAPYQALYPTNLHFVNRYPGLGTMFDRLLQTHPYLVQDVSCAAEAAIARLKIPLHATAEQYDWQRESSPSWSDLDDINRGHAEDYYREQQEQKAAQQQYALDTERRDVPSSSVGRGNADSGRQHYDANTEFLRRLLRYP